MTLDLRGGKAHAFLSNKQDSFMIYNARLHLQVNEVTNQDGAFYWFGWWIDLGRT